MFVEKRFTTPKPQQKTINLEWDQQDLKVCSGVYAKDGIKPLYDVTKYDRFDNSEDALQGGWSTSLGYVEWMADGRLCVQAYDWYEVVSNDVFDFVKVLEVDSGLLFLTNKGVLHLSKEDTFATYVNGAPNMVSGVMHSGRLFAVTGTDNKLYFSPMDNPTNWQDAGWLQFDLNGGKCLAVVSFGGYLYVFRNSQVEKVSAFADEEGFSVQSLPFCCGKLYADSLSCNQQGAYFLTDWGLWLFDGKLFKRRAKHLDGVFARNNDYAVGCCTSLGYVVACKLNVDTSNLLPNACTNNAVVVINDDSTVTMLGWDCPSVGTCNGLPFLAHGNCCYLITEDASKSTLYRCCRMTTAFHYPSKNKRVGYVYFESIRDCQLVITADGVSKTFDVAGKVGLQAVYVNLVGKKFVFNFSAQSPLQISNLTVDYDLYKGGV